MLEAGRVTVPVKVPLPSLAAMFSVRVGTMAADDILYTHGGDPPSADDRNRDRYRL